jgi:DNA-binding NarL/FixJ family response regulator
MIAGAQGYLTKDSAPEQLAEAVRKLRAGGRYISPALAEALAKHLQRPSREPHERLSEREFSVLKMIAAGKSASDIGLELNVSPKTVSTYRSRILEKLGVDSNAALTRYVIEKKLGES